MIGQDINVNKNVKEKTIFTIYILGFLLMAVVMMLYQPYNDLVSSLPLNPPDEPDRSLIPFYICNYGKIPVGVEEEVRIANWGFSYGLYNTLPYIVQGYFMRFISIFSTSKVVLIYAGRSINVLFGVLMAWLVYKIGLKIFDDDRFRWLFCFAVMYLPECLFVHTYINTDSGCLLSTAIMIYALICAYQNGFNWRNSLGLSIGISICALSYYNAYGYILCSILLGVGYYVNKKDGKWSVDWKNMGKYGVMITILVLIGAGWWFVRSYIVLDGDILGFRTKNELALAYGIEETKTTSSYYAMGVSLYHTLKDNLFFRCLYDSFVAVFGSLSIRGTWWTYFSYKLFFFAGGVGIILGIIMDVVSGKIKNVTSKRVFFHINMIISAVLPLVILIVFSYTMNYQHQGRYILPSVIPIMYYMVSGIEKLANVKISGRKLPEILINIGVAFTFFIVTGSAVYMVFFRALPLYKQIGFLI